jgi:hypothetical protein
MSDELQFVVSRQARIFGYTRQTEVRRTLAGEFLF